MHMKKNVKILISATLMLCCIFLATSCNDNENAMGKGEVEFEITDAPSDDATIQGVYVTVADVQVNGKSIAGFSGKQTLNLKTYQEGMTKLLGSAELDARTYSNLTLVLDLNEDANGNFPGCYVLADNIKYKLANTASGIVQIAISKPWTVRENSKTKIVLDVDLRKAIRYTDDPEMRYAFQTNLSSSVRLVAREKTGTINGTFDGNIENNEQIIVYAYKKGTFNAETETSAEGSLMFRNAVNSSAVKPGLLENSYTLAFMEEGEYELVFATYSKDTNTGKFNLEALIDASLQVNGKVSNSIKVEAGVNLTVTTKVNGSLG